MSNTELGLALLALARAAISERLELPARHGAVDTHHPRLYEPGASFVTLTHEGRLRGCIGSLDAYRPLAEDVRANAQAAAFRDPRFSPLSATEFERTTIEVSLLTPPEPIACRDEAGLLAQLRPGQDGLILHYGRCHATFLPQVWDSLPKPQRFVGELKRKAGLPADFWHQDLRVARYEVVKWVETS